MVDFRGPTPGTLDEGAGAAHAAGMRLDPITDDWCLDCVGQRLIGQRGVVLLPALEFRLLEVFRRNPEVVLSRDRLLDLAWGRDFDGTDRAVDRTVCRLRHLLEPDPGHPRYLRTRRGAGYSYHPPRAQS